MKKIISLLALTALISVNATAMTSRVSPWHKIFFLGYGLTQTSHNQTLVLFNTPAPGLSNQYINDSDAESAVMLGFGLSKTVTTLDNGTDISVGGEALYIRNDSARGTVHPMIKAGTNSPPPSPIVNVAPNFDTLRFSYDIESYVFLASATAHKKKVAKTWGGYISGGIGGAINRLSDYMESIPPGSTAAPMLFPFRNKTKGRFAFSVGAGLTHEVGSHSLVAFGYRYVNTNSGQLGTTPQQTGQTLGSKVLGHHLLTLSVIT